MRTSLSTCNRKARYATKAEAARAGQAAAIRLCPYRCDLCRQYHLTSRTRGMFVSRKYDKAAR